MLETHQKQVVLIISLIVGLFPFGCTKKAPSCAEKETKVLVIQIARDELVTQMGRSFGTVAAEETKKIGLDVINVRTTNFNKEVGKYECAADLEMTGEGKTSSLPITYTSELADGGKKHFVSVYGL